MKKLLTTAAVLLALARPAHADQLPAFFLGQWCGDGEYYTPTADEPCEGTKNFNTGEWWRSLTIKRNALMEQESCRFRNIKTTSDLRPTHTQTKGKADMTPVTDIIAHCTEGDGMAVVKLRLIPQKGSLSIERKILRYLS
jgi:hypothetical protein